MTGVAARQACHDGEMSETFKWRIAVEELGPWTVFAPGAMDGQIGKPVQAILPGTGILRNAVNGILRSAVVSDDGSEIEVTMEVPDGTLPPGRPQSSSSPDA